MVKDRIQNLYNITFNHIIKYIKKKIQQPKIKFPVINKNITMITKK